MTSGARAPRPDRRAPATRGPEPPDPASISARWPGRPLPLRPRSHRTPHLEVVAHQPGDLHLIRSEEHTSELQSRENLVCRLLLEKKKKQQLRTEEQTYKLQ